jgi:hypothetical protein
MSIPPSLAVEERALARAVERNPDWDADGSGKIIKKRTV